jgi:hypothetical protein
LLNSFPSGPSPGGPSASGASPGGGRRPIWQFLVLILPFVPLLYWMFWLISARQRRRWADLLWGLVCLLAVATFVYLLGARDSVKTASTISVLFMFATWFGSIVSAVRAWRTWPRAAPRRRFERLRENARQAWVALAHAIMMRLVYVYVTFVITLLAAIDAADRTTAVVLIGLAATIDIYRNRFNPELRVSPALFAASVGRSEIDDQVARSHDIPMKFVFAAGLGIPIVYVCMLMLIAAIVELNSLDVHLRNYSAMHDLGWYVSNMQRRHVGELLDQGLDERARIAAHVYSFQYLSMYVTLISVAIFGGSDAARNALNGGKTLQSDPGSARSATIAKTRLIFLIGVLVLAPVLYLFALSKMAGLINHGRIMRNVSIVDSNGPFLLHSFRFSFLAVGSLALAYPFLLMYVMRFASASAVGPNRETSAKPS